MTDQKDRGLYDKFKIERTDGSHGPGGKHEHCRYFVLDLDHDPYALPAIEAYAKSCKTRYPALSEDLQRELDNRIDNDASADAAEAVIHAELRADIEKALGYTPRSPAIVTSRGSPTGMTTSRRRLPLRGCVEEISKRYLELTMFYAKALADVYSLRSALSTVKTVATEIEKGLVHPLERKDWPGSDI